MAIQPGSDIIIDIDKPAAGGRMLGRHHGQIVFVAGAIPGEQVRARVTRVSKQLAFADTLEVLSASPDRRADAADWGCGGSFYAHIEYQRQLALKAEIVSDALARIGKVSIDRAVTVTPSAEDGYRMRARLHVSEGRFGFFREGTHELCDAGPTRQLLPATIAALEELSGSLRGSNINAVTSCDVVENVPADERAVLLGIARPESAALDPGAVPGITGFVLADHQSAHPRVVYGSPYVTEHLEISGGTAVLSHHVQSFFQGNRYLLPVLVERVLAHVTDGAVTDLYAGVGLFAISLAARGLRDITAVESDRAAARDLDANAARYGNAIRVEHLPVEDYLSRRTTPRPDTMIVDPPRTGLSREALSRALALKPKRIVYVSCDVATLARDMRHLIDRGYRLGHIEALDLFPNSAHIETLAVLSYGSHQA